MSLSPYLLWLGWLLLRVAAMTERPLLDSLKEDHPNLIYDHDILPHDTRGSWTNEHPSKKARHDFAGGAHALIDANNGGYPQNLIDHSLLDDFETQVILERTLGDLWNLPPLPAVDRDHRTRSSNYPLGGTQDGLEARQSRETAQVSDHSGSTSPSKESRTSPVTKPSSENDSRQASLTAPEANSPLGKGRDNAESNVMNSNESDLPSNATPALSHPPGQYESQSPPKQPGMKRGQDDIDPHVMDSSPPLPAVDRYHQSESINALGSTRDGDKGLRFTHVSKRFIGILILPSTSAHQSRETAPVSDDSGGASPSKGPRPSPGIKPSDENDLRQPYLAATAANIPPGEGKHDGVPHAIGSNEPDSPSDTTPALSHPPGQSEPHSPSEQSEIKRGQDDVEQHVMNSSNSELPSNTPRPPAPPLPSREFEPQHQPGQPKITSQSPQTQPAPIPDDSYAQDDANLNRLIDPAQQSKERARSSSHHEDIGPFKKQRTLNSNQPSDDDIEEPSLTATGANHLLGKDQDDVEPHVTDSTELDLLSNAAPALSHPSRESEPQSHPEQPEMTRQSPERLEATQLAPSSDSSFVPDDAHLKGSIESSHQPNERVHLLSHYEDISPFKKQRTVQTSQPSDDDMEKPFPTTVWMNSSLEGGRGQVEPHPVTDSKDSDMPIKAIPVHSSPTRESVSPFQTGQPELTRQISQPAGDTGPSVETTSPADKDDGTIQSHPALMIDKGGKQHKVSYNQGTPETTSDLPQGKSSMASRMRKISLSPRQKNTILPTPDQMIALDLNREIMAPAMNIDEGMKEPLVSSTRGISDTTNHSSGISRSFPAVELINPKKQINEIGGENLPVLKNGLHDNSEPLRLKSIVKTEESVDESPISLNHGTRGTSTDRNSAREPSWLTHKIRVKEEPYEIEQTEQQPRGKWRSRKPDYLSRVEEPSTRLRRRIDRIAATLYETHFTDRFVKVMEERCKIFQWRVDQEHEAFMNSPSRKIVRTGDPSNEGSEGSRDSWITLPQKKSLSDIMESFRLLIRGSYYVMKVTLKGLYDMGVMRVPGENEYFDWLLAKTFNSLDGYKMLTQLGSETEEIPLLKQRAIEYLSLPQSSQNPLKESIHFLGIFYKNGQPEVWRTIGNNDQEFWRFMKNQCKQFEERIERGKQISQELGPDRDILQLSGVKQILLDPPIRLTNLFKRYLLKKEYGFAYMERKPLYLIEKMYEIRKKTQHRVQETIPNEDLPFYMSRHWDLKRKTIRFNIGLILKYKPKSDTKSELVDKMQTILLPAHRFFKAIYHSEFRSELPPESYNSMFCDWTTNVIGGRGATLPIVGYIYRDSPEMKIESYTDIQLLLIDHLVKQKNTKQLLTAGISLLAFWFREQKPQDWKRRFKADSGAFFKFVTEVVEQTY
ncbi:hypothetical protein MJO28_006008 [Puccinia striiformis f. sp. tritici]|uniref:Uncharacterized protein n=1 Tax=Puccinia striiformis f. sp. tritici TaxID=168172 RepID=A0ACC0EFT4_9BASI|nr:hypothetical protein MJO28_006008 [Puccinia striiformis f. sp. tritici]